MRLVDIRPLKQFAVRHLPDRSMLRQLLLLEHDYLQPEEFLIKMDSWIKLLQMESGDKK